ncbi:cation:proton antiporter domain-containing protein [Methylobrevis albus]|uniref:Cation:proton antiporter n=1 Tax=Methylobrevis albus TaxID=2793297 RepID=A0A931I3C9_9HYPH|nr:cation:proton antiporter [Methylobrevis albus]MBH0238684.1 cation:proton antiporter [Methylobrevis albus]
MPHETTLISTIVVGLVLAFALGAIAQRLRMPPLVGYLIAGVLSGPHTPGFVADQTLAPQLAEIGVILLMFGVGLHFSLKDLLSVRAIAIPGAVAQMSFATLLGWGLSAMLGWSLGGGLVFGLALSVASTVVLLKALQDRRLIETERGRIAVGWLIVEDLAMVMALVLIPAVASIAGDGTAARDPLAIWLGRALGMDLGLYGVIGVTLLKVAAFVGLMLVVGRRVIPWVLHRIAYTGSRELFRLAVLAIALGVAFFAAEMFGVSLALGAFFAGMILAESELSHQAAQETLPLRDAFAVLFFVSVGMLFDPTIIVTSPLPVLATVFIIVIGKSLAAFLIVLAFRRTVGTALTISASLAQIGEFSFILAELGVGLNLLPEEGRDLILAGAIISIVLNPLVFLGVDRIKARLEAAAQRFDAKPAATGDAAAKATATKAPAATAKAPAAAAKAPAPAPVATAPTETVAAPAEPVIMPPAEPEAVATPPEPAEEQPRDDDTEAARPTRLKDHTVLVGYGRVGSIVGEGLIEDDKPFLVIEDADSRVDMLRDKGVEVVVGNAASADVLALANVAGARNIVIAIPNAFEAGQVTEQARKLNAGILICNRAHTDAEVEHLSKLGSDSVIMGEREIARGMLARLDGPRRKSSLAPAAPEPAPSRAAEPDGVYDDGPVTPEPGPILPQRDGRTES